MSAANSNSERVHQPLPPPPLPLLPPLTINDNEYKNSKKKTKTKKRLVVDIDIGRSNIDVNIDKEKEKESLILVRDPPRERLARSRGPLVSADEGVHEEQLLVSVSSCFCPLRICANARVEVSLRCLKYPDIHGTVRTSIRSEYEGLLVAVLRGISPCEVVCM